MGSFVDLFQFTPLREGRRLTPFFLRNSTNFNSRPSARGDRLDFAFVGLREHFNSRPSARGDDERTEMCPRCSYFNSRPSARGDGSNVNLQRAAILISIHAPPRGATKPRRTLRATLRDFNSRPSARGDRRRGRQRKQSPISIHAPPRGATATITDAATGQLFQFTPLREGRLCGFPTTFALQISIHAPPRGATHQLLDGKICFAISIHAPPRGATCGAAHSSRQIAFQFTPLREGRPPGRSPRRSSLYFNSRPSARGDTGL